MVGEVGILQAENNILENVNLFGTDGLLDVRTEPRETSKEKKKNREICEVLVSDDNVNVSFDTQGVYENGYNSGNGEKNNEEYVPVELSPIKEQRPDDQDGVIRERIGAKKLADFFSNLSVSKTPSNNKLLQGF